jgi:hypothetical protein
VYTSPIKALSNQKYAEFQSWFKRRGLAAGVSLLTVGFLIIVLISISNWLAPDQLYLTHVAYVTACRATVCELII